MRALDLKDRDQEYFAACCEEALASGGATPIHVGYVDHFKVAERLGLSVRWSATRFEKFARWGWFENRNNYDAWLTPRGLLEYRSLKGT